MSCTYNIILCYSCKLASFDNILLSLFWFLNANYVSAEVYEDHTPCSASCLFSFSFALEFEKCFGFHPLDFAVLSWWISYHSTLLAMRFFPSQYWDANSCKMFSHSTWQCMTVEAAWWNPTVILALMLRTSHACVTISHKSLAKISSQYNKPQAQFH